MPFASYKDFDDCVRKNKDKENPEAYCASIMRRAEGKDAVAMAAEMSKKGNKHG